jgi:Integrase core domain
VAEGATRELSGRRGEGPTARRLDAERVLACRPGRSPSLSPTLIGVEGSRTTWIAPRRSQACWAASLPRPSKNGSVLLGRVHPHRGKLKTFVKSEYFHLYGILNVFSRFVVGWMVVERESGHLASLGITKSHSRPHVSDDNPFSEAHFKTLKYCPDFPERFASLAHARGFLRKFFAWYNTQHRHDALALLTPHDVHHGLVAERLESRARVFDAAYAAHPERFVRSVPVPAAPPKTVWINPPKFPPATEEAQAQIPPWAVSKLLTGSVTYGVIDSLRRQHAQPELAAALLGRNMALKAPYQANVNANKTCMAVRGLDPLRGLRGERLWKLVLRARFVEPRL